MVSITDWTQQEPLEKKEDTVTKIHISFRGMDEIYETPTVEYNNIFKT
jgi:hypothetical protein